MAAVNFTKPEVVITQPCIELSSKFGMQIDFGLLNVCHHQTDNWKYICDAIAAILKNRYDVITPPWIDRFLKIKFDMPMQFSMPRTTNRSESKPEAEFQYGGRPFSETGSSNNSAVNEISKFGMQMNFDLLKRVPSLNPQPEVDLQRHSHRLEKSTCRHNAIGFYFIWMKFGRSMKQFSPY